LEIRRVCLFSQEMRSADERELDRCSAGGPGPGPSIGHFAVQRAAASFDFVVTASMQLQLQSFIYFPSLW